MKAHSYVDVHERLSLIKTIPLSLQHVFAMFGATVLVPILTKLDPSVALFTSGLGTLIYIACTQGKVPAYLGSSFAFIAPIIAVSAQLGPRAALAGCVAAGLVYLVVASVIWRIGLDWLDRLLPPVVIGSVIIVIGMGLAGTAIGMAGLNAQNASIMSRDVQIALFTLAVSIAGSIFFKGFLGVIPILVGVVSGYIFAILRGAVDLTAVAQARWLAVPSFSSPQFSWAAIAAIAPVALVTITEHLGDTFVTSKVVGRDFYKNPGLHRTLLGDGLATSVAGLLGGPPNTTYGENIGVMAITRVYSVWVIGGAALIAILLSFVQKLGAAIRTIPTPVMGGICILLFGIIAASGLRTLVESGIDYSNKRNLVISSVILVIGIGGARLSFGPVQYSSMALATLTGILLNLILPDMRPEPEEQEEPAPGHERMVHGEESLERGVTVDLAGSGGR
ncbi:MAG TPA: uracil permease [Firmicutes bacterium]|nr:uracil permease [Bacillota bacterium]